MAEAGPTEPSSFLDRLQGLTPLAASSPISPKANFSSLVPSFPEQEFHGFYDAQGCVKRSQSRVEKKSSSPVRAQSKLASRKPKSNTNLGSSLGLLATKDSRKRRVPGKVPKTRSPGSRGTASIAIKDHLDAVSLSMSITPAVTTQQTPHKGREPNPPKLQLSNPADLEWLRSFSDVVSSGTAGRERQPFTPSTCVSPEAIRVRKIKPRPLSK